MRELCVVGTEGRCLQCKEGSGERMIGGEWDQLGDCGDGDECGKDCAVGIEVDAFKKVELTDVNE